MYEHQRCATPNCRCDPCKKKDL